MSIGSSRPVISPLSKRAQSCLYGSDPSVSSSFPERVRSPRGVGDFLGGMGCCREELVVAERNWEDRRRDKRNPLTNNNVREWTRVIDLVRKMRRYFNFFTTTVDFFPT